jgi:hypothetical protein
MVLSFKKKFAIIVVNACKLFYKILNENLKILILTMKFLIIVFKKYGTVFEHLFETN